MAPAISGRARIRAVLAVIAAGLLSRMWRTGSVLMDKYLGDALYAAMVYLLLPGFGWRRAGWAMGIMTALECFQLTGIPASMAASPWLGWRFIGRLLGTTFGWGDLAAYTIGMATVFFWERRQKPGQLRRVIG